MASALRAGDRGIATLLSQTCDFNGCCTSVCLAKTPGVTKSVLGLVSLVSVDLDWVRWRTGPAACLRVAGRTCVGRSVFEVHTARLNNRISLSLCLSPPPPSLSLSLSPPTLPSPSLFPFLLSFSYSPPFRLSPPPQPLRSLSIPRPLSFFFLCLSVCFPISS